MNPVLNSCYIDKIEKTHTVDPPGRIADPEPKST